MSHPIERLRLQKTFTKVLKHQKKWKCGKGGL